MNLNDYFDAPSMVNVPRLIASKDCLQTNLHPQKKGVLDADVALIGVKNDTNSLYNKGCKDAPDLIRSCLYALNGKLNNIYVSDLGNIKPGKGLNDTYFALQDVVTYLLEQRVIPIIIGGSHDLSFPICKAIAEKKEAFNLAVIDSTIDALNPNEMDDHCFLNQIKKTFAIHNLSVLGVQGYQSIEDEEIEILPLKQVRSDIASTEPVLRDADFTSFDISAIKAADAPGCAYSSPNGLNPEHACKLAQYAGLSDRISAFGIFGINPLLDKNIQSSQLAAQIIWHFLNGLDNRFKDYPLRDIQSYSKKIVHQQDIDRAIVFYHNIQNNRWWFNAATEDDMEIISCTLEDYLQTRKGDLPNRVLRFLS